MKRESALNRKEYWRTALPVERVSSKDPHAYDELIDIMDEYDPIGIVFPCAGNWGEYSPEAKTIMYRLEPYMDYLEVREVVFQEMIAWFDRDLVLGRDTRMRVEEMVEAIHHWNKNRKKVRAY